MGASLHEWFSLLLFSDALITIAYSPSHLPNWYTPRFAQVLTIGIAVLFSCIHYNTCLLAVTVSFKPNHVICTHLHSAMVIIRKVLSIVDCVLPLVLQLTVVIVYLVKGKTSHSIQPGSEHHPHMIAFRWFSLINLLFHTPCVISEIIVNWVPFHRLHIFLWHELLKFLSLSVQASSVVILMATYKEFRYWLCVKKQSSASADSGTDTTSDGPESVSSRSLSEDLELVSLS